MTTAENVARYLVELGYDRGAPINNSQLQRLLYYVQAWHLAEHDRPLFPETFEAWIYGPAIPSIYWTYDPYGWQPLPRPVSSPMIPECDAAFIREIANDYLPLDEWQLQDLACNEAPWLNARGGIPHDDPCTAAVSEDDMRLYYRQLAAAA